MWTLHKLNTRDTSRRGPSSICDPPARPSGPSSSRQTDTSAFPWEFPAADLERFPALRKRNFFCIQRHQARALHYDLRLQLDGGTLSWAIPKGLIGMDKKGESSRMAVQTTIHPISYTTHEGSDGTVFSSGKRAGTLLWDIGEYEITNSRRSVGSDSEDERRKKRRKVSPEAEDPLGKHEEDKLRDRFTRVLPTGNQRTIRLTLKGGRKMTGQTFIFVLDVQNSRSSTFGRGGVHKKTWFVRLPADVDRYDWDQGGEDGEFWGRSVKTGRTFFEVCSSAPRAPKMFKSELKRFEGWSETVDELGTEEQVRFSVKLVTAAA